MSEEIKKPRKEKKPKSKARQIIEWVLTGIFLVIFAFVGIGQVDAMIHKSEHYQVSLSYGYAYFYVLSDSMEKKDENGKLIDGFKVKDAIITHHDSISSIYKKLYQGRPESEHASISEDDLPHIDITFYDCYQGSAPQIYHPSIHVERTDVKNMPMTHRLRELHYYPDVKYGEGQYVFIVSGINDESLDWKINQYQVFTEKEFLGVVKMKSTVIGGFFGFVSSPWGLLVLLLIPSGYLVIVSVLDLFKAFDDKEEGTSTASNGQLSGLSEKDKKRLKEEMLEEMLKKKQEEKKGGNE
ncbi:MAG: hypothetical protein K6C32_04155 [Bacilli bacterium]|nr:hypothetical protein [Bacilli bacterium]